MGHKQSPQVRSRAAQPSHPPPPAASMCGLHTYHRSQVLDVYKEPFIINGYRKSDSSFSECVRYAFVGHNDVCNFWSHFLPLCVWLSWLYLLSYRYDLSDPYYLPLLCFWVGSCSYVLFSSLAHLFGCKSFTTRTVCFMLDYFGISVYVAGGGLSAFYYQQPLSSPLYDYNLSVLCVHMLLCISSTVISSLSRFYWVKQRYVIRALAYMPSYFSSITPFCLRMLSCVTAGEDCMHQTLHLHFISIVCTWLLLFFFVTKIPERLVPGRFDIFGQSHTFFHLSSAVLTSIQMYMFPIDAEFQKAALLSKISPDLSTTFLPFLTMVVVGLLHVCLFAVLVVKKKLIPHNVACGQQPAHLNSKEAKQD